MIVPLQCMLARCYQGCVVGVKPQPCMHVGSTNNAYLLPTNVMYPDMCMHHYASMRLATPTT